MNEFDIIADVFAPLAASPFAFGLKDDAAAIPPRPGFDLVVSSDTITQDVDFFAADPPAIIARKALRVSLSDLAAKGAVPAFYLLNLTLPAHADIAWLHEFARGLRDDQEKYEIALLGGDTGAGPLSVTVTAFGYVPAGAMIRRAGARPGDGVYVTGTIGDSGGGLWLLRGEDGAGISAADRNFLIGQYRLPSPPVSFGPLLRGLAHSALDISDGLIADLGHIGETSGVRMIVEGSRIPRSPALRALWGEDAEAVIRAVTSGDDYQIAFTAAPSHEVRLMAAARDGIAIVTRIGAVEAGRGVALIIEDAEIPVPRPGYRHF